VTLVLVDFLKNSLVASMSFGFVCSSQSFLPSAAHHEPRFAQAVKATLKRFLLIDHREVYHTTHHQWIVSKKVAKLPTGTDQLSASNPRV